MKLFTFTFTSLVVLLLIAIPAQAHTVKHSRCDIVWSAAKPGKKWEAKQECLRRVKAHNLRHVCAKPRPIVRGITAKKQRASFTQRRNVTIALNVGRSMRVPANHQVAMVAAATQEASLYNNPWGHGTSVGFLQLIDTHEPDGVGHDWRMDIHNSAGWFFSGARQIDPRGNARINPGDLAQRVQRSAHPTLYYQWVREARTTYRKFLGPCPK